MLAQFARMELFEDIKNSSEWKFVEKVSKGWSSDSKYFIKTVDGKLLLLRISDIEQYENKKKEYEIITKYSQLDFPMSAPIDFGICNGGKNVYMLLSWVEGKDMEEVLSDLPETEQYQLGREAGKILKRIHSVEVAADDRPKDTKKLLQLSRYEESQVRIDGDEIAIQYVRENIDKIWKMRPVYLHGDYHPGNLIYTNEGSIGVIDFNRWEVGDSYEEFYKLESFGIEHSVPYCIGQIDAYFDDKIPEDFGLHLQFMLHTLLCIPLSGRKNLDKKMLTKWWKDAGKLLTIMIILICIYRNGIRNLI